MILHNSIRVAQNLSRRNSHAQIKLGDMPSLNNRIRLTYGDRDKGEQYSGSWQNNVKRGLEAPTKNVESCEDNQPSLRGEPLHNSLIVAQNRPFLRGAVHSITKSPDIKWSTEYQKKNEIKHLKWIPLCIYSGVHLKGVHLQDIAKPGSARTLTGPLTTKIVNVSRQL